MPLLNQTPKKEEEMPAAEGKTSAFDSAEIENPIIDQLQGQAKADVERVVTEGTKFLFSEQAMPMVFGSIRPEDEIPLEEEMGAAAVNVMKILVDKSGGSMPPEAILPAGTILLARAGEFINQEGLGEVTYDVFAEAEKIFSEVIVDEARKGESQQQPQEQLAPEQAPSPQRGGMLNQGVR